MRLANTEHKGIAMNDEQWGEAIEAMKVAGAKAGKASASWLLDGNSDEAGVRAMLKQWEDGDPDAPSAPDPFSGEWASEPSLAEVIEAETDYEADTLEPEEADELGTAYEDAFAEAWQAEAERSACAMLSDS